MKSADPYRRTSLEVQILGYLNDLGHMIGLRDLVAKLNPDASENIICTVFDFKDEGLVTVRELDEGGQVVQITPQGKSILLAIYSGKTPCD